ncbi:hypothetical protein ACT4MK_46725 [Bradyrhizobium barranii]
MAGDLLDALEDRHLLNQPGARSSPRPLATVIASTRTSIFLLLDISFHLK